MAEAVAFGRCPRWLAASAFAAGVVFAALTAFDVVFAPVEKDEGAYDYAFRLVAEGQVPYRDFSYIESPGLPYYYALLLRGPGISIRSVRVLSALTGLGGLLLLIRCAARAAGGSAAAVTAILLLTNPYLAEYFACDVTYPLITLILAAALTLELSKTPLSLRMAGQGALLAWAGAVKVSMGLVALIWLGMLLWSRRRHLGAVLAGIGAFAATLALTVGPLFLADPAAFRFNVLDAPRLRGSLFPFMSKPRPLDQFLEFGWGQKPAAVRTILLWHSPMLVLGLMTLLWSRGRRGLREERILGGATGPVVASLAAGALFHVFVPFPAYPNYLFLILPALAVPLAILYVRRIPPEVQDRQNLPWLALPLILGCVHLMSGLAPDRVGLEIGCYRKGLEREMVRVVESIVPADGFLLTDYLPVAVESGRRVVPGNEGGRTSLIPQASDAEAASWRVLNRQAFLSVLRDGRAQGVLLTEQLFDDSFAQVPGFIEETANLLAARYDLFREIDPGPYFRYGRVKIYRLKEGNAAPWSPPGAPPQVGTGPSGGDDLEHGIGGGKDLANRCGPQVSGRPEGGHQGAGALRREGDQEPPRGLGIGEQAQVLLGQGTREPRPFPGQAQVAGGHGRRHALPDEGEALLVARQSSHPDPDSDGTPFGHFQGVPQDPEPGDVGAGPRAVLQHQAAGRLVQARHLAQGLFQGGIGDLPVPVGADDHPGPHGLGEHQGVPGQGCGIPYHPPGIHHSRH